MWVLLDTAPEEVPSLWRSGGCPHWPRVVVSGGETCTCPIHTQGLNAMGPGRALPPRETASQGNGHQAETRGPRLLADAVLMAGRLICQMRVPALGHDFLHQQPVLRKYGVCAGGTVRTGPCTGQQGPDSRTWTLTGLAVALPPAHQRL